MVLTCGGPKRLSKISVRLARISNDFSDYPLDLRRSRTSPWVQRYTWPIYFFIAVAFWNMVGAGLFGFMINPPIALYYMQGLNTTPVHGHAALFGIYGMRGIGLMLACLRVLIPDKEWKDGLLRFSCWSMNGGLMAMCVLSLLPVGLLQTWASVDQGYWDACSSEFMQTDLMQTLRWMRVPGDTVFFLGAVGLVVFVAELLGKPSLLVVLDGDVAHLNQPQMAHGPLAFCFNRIKSYVL